MHFTSKVDSIRSCMQLEDVNLTCSFVNSIVKEKSCFAFAKVNQDTVEEVLLFLSDDISWYR